jgi:DNA-3-methyladenine glycosylase II
MDLADHPLPAPVLRAALDDLATRDPALRSALDRLGYPPPRQRPPGFSTLIQIMVAQQLSTRAAAAIWGRLEARLCGQVTAAGLLVLGEAELRAAGFSRQKAAYALLAAEAAASGSLALDRLGEQTEAAVIAAISGLKGFGRWSAEIYLLFALGRGDAFPADDLAIQIGMQRLRGLERRPHARLTRDLALPWRPHRGCGALLLWHLYGSTTLARPAARPTA